MGSILTKAVKKAKMYVVPTIVYMNETNNLDYCSLEVFESRYCRAIYIILSDGTFEKIGTANIHHG